MNKFSFLYLVFFYFLAAIYSLFGYISPENQIIGSLFLIILFGIPHGAIDNVLLLSESDISTSRFYAYYVLSIISYVIIWFISPVFSFVFFYSYLLIISENHNSQITISYHPLRNLFILFGVSF